MGLVAETRSTLVIISFRDCQSHMFGLDLDGVIVFERSFRCMYQQAAATSHCIDIDVFHSPGMVSLCWRQ